MNCQSVPPGARSGQVLAPTGDPPPAVVFAGTARRLSLHRVDVSRETWYSQRMARRPSARRLMNYAVASGNMELLSLLIIAGGLEVLHAQQAHQPATIAERVQSITDVARAAVMPATQPQPVPVRA